MKILSEKIKLTLQFILVIAFLPIGLAIIFVVLNFYTPIEVIGTIIPSVMNGLTTATSILVGFGLAFIGLVGREYPSKNKKLMSAIPIAFIASLVMIFGAYLYLLTNNYGNAILCSLIGFYSSLWTLLNVCFAFNTYKFADSNKI